MMLGKGIFLMTIPPHPELYNPFSWLLLLFSNLKIGEFEDLRVFDTGKAFELGRFRQCLG